MRGLGRGLTGEPQHPLSKSPCFMHIPTHSVVSAFTSSRREEPAAEHQSGARALTLALALLCCVTSEELVYTSLPKSLL